MCPPLARKCLAHHSDESPIRKTFESQNPDSDFFQALNLTQHCRFQTVADNALLPNANVAAWQSMCDCVTPPCLAFGDECPGFRDHIRVAARAFEVVPAGVAVGRVACK